MQVYAISGKGGVGKSAVSGMISVASASSGIRSGWVDCDKGGEAISRTLSSSNGYYIIGQNIFHQLEENLYGAAITPLDFSPIVPKSNRTPQEFEKYMKQFPGPMGIVVWNDMLRQFFGGFTRPEHAAELVNLAEVLHQAKEGGIERVVLDLEPTKGALALLNSAKAAASSLHNLGNLGAVVKFILGKFMPDVRAYLDSEYVRKSDHYCKRLVEATQILKDASYVLVCGPKPQLVDEMLGETKKAIETFGGKISAYVINDIRQGLEERELKSQQRQIDFVRESAIASRIPVFEVNHFPALGIDDSSDKERASILVREGRKILIPARNYRFGRASDLGIFNPLGIATVATVEQAETAIRDAWVEGEIPPDAELPDEMEARMKGELGLRE